jgi:predicted ATPase/class 3 adenylate cyclase
VATITEWLASLGISEYAERFAENDIDTSVLCHLTDQDLKELGISVGHRRKMLAAIAELATIPSATAARPEQRDAERRQITIMFCDLVGSAALSTRLDPEDLQEIIGAYHRCCAKVITQSDGFVARYLGDGVLAYFGYPQAHEDDAEQAVRAGLALVEAVAKLDAGHATSLHMRIGIATGLVIVGDFVSEGPGHENEVVGETPNLAARLQALAEPDTVVISGATRRLLGGLFEFRDHGTVPVKGFRDPVQVWQVTRASTVDSRFEALRTITTPLVGREEEIDLLMRRWRQTSHGEGRVVLLSGEPGIGKSRLTVELLERLQATSHIRLRHFCSPHHQDSALYPIISQLQLAAEFRRDDTDQQRLDKLEALLNQSSNDLKDAIPLIADLLSVSSGDRYPPRELTPRKRKEKTLWALLAQLEGLAAQEPVLMVFEDVHWIDPTSIELLDFIVDRVPTLPILLIITFRPEFVPPWVGRPHVTLLMLNRLSPAQRAELIAGVTGGKALPQEIADRIIDRTDGVPLFIEELTKTVVESGILVVAGDRYAVTGPVAPLAIPTTLQASLGARLDRLPAAREVAQIGAALGRSFSHEAITAVAQMPQQQIDKALAHLVSAGLIFRRGSPPDAEYIFKHALVRDAAYESLLKSRRQQLHAQITDFIENRSQDTAEVPPELLAHHCTEAGLTAKAVNYYHKAGQLALWRSAVAEAAVHFAKALDLLASLPVSTERYRQELRLQLARAGALFQARGWAAPQMGEAYSRAYELSRVVEDVPELEVIWARYGLWLYRVNRAELVVARQISEDILGRAKERQATGALAVAYRALGATSMFQAEFDHALAHFGLVLANYDPATHESPAFFGTTNLRVTALCFTAWVRLFQGHFADARATIREALEKARDLSHSYGLAFALLGNCLFNQVCHNWETVREQSASLRSLAAEHGFPDLLAAGTFFEGWAAFASGQTEAGVELMHRGLVATRVGGAEIIVPYYLGLLADTYSRIGRVTDALPLLADALERVEHTGERWFEAELRRLRGEALLALAPPQSEASFREALAVADAHGARLWQLHAAASLAKLWRDQGRRSEARDLLAPIYGWFTEGLDTAVLKEAKALLDELAQ